MSKTDQALADFHHAMMNLLRQPFTKEQIILLLKLSEKFEEITKNLAARAASGN